MANALAMKGTSIEIIHQTVYREAKNNIPDAIYKHLTGDDPSEPASESNSFRERATNAYRFAEFLPCFAIRPIFNQLVFVLHFYFGVGLLKATVLIPVICYFLMGIVLFVWTCRYVATSWASLICILTLLSPPVWELARSTTPDALSSFVVLSSMFLLLEERRLLAGMILLILSVYIRTDNVLIVILALTYMYAAGFGIRKREIGILAALAILSVPLINRFSGDYGAKVLYYRSFVEAPVAVGEISPMFGMPEYLTALKKCISGAVHSVYIPFFLIGAAYILRRPSRAVSGAVLVTSLYTVAHLIIFPNPESRFFGSFFVTMGLSLAAIISVDSGARPRTANTTYPPVNTESELAMTA
jgi:hypothetical protein